MRRDLKRSSDIKFVSTIAILLVFLSVNPLPFYAVDVHAQQVTIIVSAAQDPGQNNTFFGPQIVQMIIDDPGARNPDTSTGGLVVMGQSMQRVHLADGRWYAFTASQDPFLLWLDVMTDGIRDNRISVSKLDDADNRNTVGSYTMIFAQADSFVREITELDGSIFVEVSKKDIFPTLPEPFTGSGAVNPDVDLNPSAEPESDWPYVRLFSIQENDVVDIRIDERSVSLSYSRYYNDIRVALDRTIYPVDSDIIMTFKDFMWNMNPVDEDVVRFVLNRNTGIPVRIIYQPIRNFDPAGDGLNLIDLLPSLTLLEFDNRQIVEVNGVQNLKYKQAFDSSSTALVEFPEESGRLISDITGGELPMISFFEQDPNISVFTTADQVRGGRSNIFAGLRDTTASMDYFDIIATATMGTIDASVSVDKEIYDSADRAVFTILDQDLNRRSAVSETYNGIDSKTFIKLGSPFPLTNNGFFNTLPKDGTGNFLPDSIRAVRFFLGSSGTAERVDLDQDGIIDVSANSGDIDNRSPTTTDFLALDFTTEQIAGNLPTGIIVKSNVKVSDIFDTTRFTIAKAELLEKADPFIRVVSDLKPQASSSFVSAADNEKIEVAFPHYNLVYLDLSKLNAVFAKTFVEMEASNGMMTVTQMVDFEPFDDEDLDGDDVFKPDPLSDASGFGSFRVLDFVSVNWNGDSVVGDAADIAQLGNVVLKFTIIITDSANTPLPITSADHQVVLDIDGLGVIRTEGATVDDIGLDASEHLIYRPEIKEQGSNSNNFAGRTDFLTVLHDDTVQLLLNEIQVIGDPLKIWMPNRFIPPDRNTISYTDLDIAGVLRPVSTSFIYETRDGEVSWDHDQYRFSQVAILTVKDRDLNRKPDAVEQYTIPQDGFLYFEFDKQRADSECQSLTPVPEGCFARFVEATLRETSPNSSEFRAQITMPQRVLVESGDVIKTFKSDVRAVYVDVRDRSSNVNEFHDSAVIRSDIDPSQLPQEPVTKNPAVVERGSIKIALDRPDYHPFSRVHITITANDKNVDKFRSDVIFVSVARQPDNTLLNYKLTETAVNTGIFAGYIDLTGPDGRDGGVGPRDGILGMSIGDTLEISFESVTISVPIQYNEGKMYWGKSTYTIGEKGKLQVIDPDGNKDADISEILKVTLLVKNAKISYELRETEANSGVFAAEIPFVSITGTVLEKQVGVALGDTVTAVYDDMTIPEAIKSSVGTDGALPVKAAVQLGNVLEVVGINRVAQSDYMLLDEKGKGVGSPKLHEVYRIQSTVHNNTPQELEFEFIVLITDENGFVEFLQSMTQKVDPNQSVTPSIEWEPSKKNKFVIEIFVWHTLHTPAPLSKVMKNSIIIV